MKGTMEGKVILYHYLLVVQVVRVVARVGAVARVRAVGVARAVVVVVPPRAVYETWPG